MTYPEAVLVTAACKSPSNASVMMGWFGNSWNQAQHDAMLVNCQG
ncbi:hypothetical protein [Janthinobacterium sp. B9-8]|nr:hypothetical protein [Janthinobacterium sp. B9-8]